ncbi:FliH/SctL family protein [Undibacterium sp. Ji49W]|uniref:FliH/SctL family protein n=1 Tax=Undibacterium sp. Ji49W TaxID=3413040 RepID=UPI003BF312E1
MKGQPNNKKNTQILRDVLVHNHVHTLQRPGRAGEKKGSVKIKLENDFHSSDGMHVNTSFNLPVSQLKPSVIDRFEEGHLAGKSEGYALALHEQAHSQQAELDKKREQIFQEAFKLGQQQGFAIGQKEGQVTAQSEANELKSRLITDVLQLENLMKALPGQLSSSFMDMEDDMVALCFSAICSVIGDNITSEPILRLLVATLVKQHLTDTEFSVHLHPDDYQVVSKKAISSDEIGMQIRWVSDVNVKVGGIIIRSSEQSLDARLDFQIELLKKNLLSTRESRKKQAVIEQKEYPAANQLLDKKSALTVAV